MYTDPYEIDITTGNLRISEEKISGKMYFEGGKKYKVKLRYAYSVHDYCGMIQASKFSFKYALKTRK